MNIALKASREAFKAISSAWNQLQEHAEIGVIRNDRDYKRTVMLLDTIIDEIGSDENHPLASLAGVLGEFIERYEEKNVHVPEASPREVLEFLMQENGLKQSDLKKELGSQGIVSEILSAKRSINARQAKALAARFGVSPAVFL